MFRVQWAVTKILSPWLDANMEAVRGDWRSCLIQLYNIRWFKCTRYAAHVVHASCVVMCVNVTKSSLLSRYNDSTLCPAKYGVPLSLSFSLALFFIQHKIVDPLISSGRMFEYVPKTLQRACVCQQTCSRKITGIAPLNVCVDLLDLFVAVQDAICQLIWCQRLSDRLKFNYCLLVCHSLILFLFRRLPCSLCFCCSIASSHAQLYRIHYLNNKILRHFDLLDWIRSRPLVLRF